MVVNLDVGLAFEYSGSQSNEILNNSKFKIQNSKFKNKFVGAQSFAPLPSPSVQALLNSEF